MLRIFYESVGDSAILYAAACWCSRLRVADSNRLCNLIGKASDVVGIECDSLMVMPERKMLTKLWKILDSVSHPLHSDCFVIPVSIPAFNPCECLCVQSIFHVLITDFALSLIYIFP